MNSGVEGFHIRSVEFLEGKLRNTNYSCYRLDFAAEDKIMIVAIG
jgi:hypothetical protein